MQVKTNNSGKGISAFALLRTVKRRKFYLLIPILLLTPAVCVYALKLPQKFRARALVGAELIPGQPPLNGRVDQGTEGALEQMRAVRDTLLSPSALASISEE